MALEPDFRLSVMAARTPVGAGPRERIIGLLRQAGLPE
jgi:hypothetical protein